MFETKILGTGSYHPDNIVTNNDLAKRVDTNDEWIVQRTGIKERRVGTVEKGEFPSGMAVHAAKAAIESAGIDPEEIELILFSVTLPDMLFPNTASHLQKQLGLNNNCACLDINAACSGWLYGMKLADGMIKTGQYKRILLVGCEMTSAFNNWDDRNTCILFGDGCGAVVLGPANTGDESKIYGSVLGSDSSKMESLILRNGGSMSPITHEILDKNEQYCTMDGQTVFKAAVKTMVKHAAQLIEESPLGMDDVNWFIPHQANLRIIEAVAKMARYPMDQVIVTVDKYANTSSASIPAALDEAVRSGKIKRGDNILMTAFGAGLTSAGALIKY